MSWDAVAKSDIAAAAALFVSVLGFFAWLNKYASEAAKAQVTQWLKAPIKVEIGVAEIFLSLFSLVYGKRILSVRGLLRSALVTTIVCLVLGMVWVVAKREELLLLAASQGDALHPLYFSTYEFAKYFLFFLVMFSIPADYGALMVSKVFIERSIASVRAWRRVAFLLLGIVGCILLYSISLIAMSISFGPFIHNIGDLPLLLQIYFGFGLIRSGFYFGHLTLSFPGSGPRELVGTFGPFAYSTLFVFAWYGLLAAAAIVLKSTVVGRQSISFLTWFFDVEKYPLICVGTIAAAIASVAYLVVRLAFGIT